MSTARIPSTSSKYPEMHKFLVR